MRRYPFKLPYHVSKFTAGFVVSKLKQYAIWNELPRRFQERMLNCGWNGFDIHKRDLDALPDSTWHKLERLMTHYGTSSSGNQTGGDETLY